MPLPPSGQMPKDVERSAAGVLARIGETLKVIVTVSDQMARLAKEDERAQTQIFELTKLVFSLSKDVASLSGQMQGIEKRLDDRERLMEVAIALRIKEEIGKLKQ